MSTIRNRPDVPVPVADRSGKASDDHVRELIQEIRQERTRIRELAKLEVTEMSAEAQVQVAQFLAQQLQGRVPADILKAMHAGEMSPEILQAFLLRFGNEAQQSPKGAAEAQATPGDVSNPNHALQWSQFVQASQHSPGGGGLQERSGSASPKGEGTTLAELIQKRRHGAGLKNPKLVQKSLADMSPAQRQQLLEACFGTELAHKLHDLGLGDPFMLLRAGASPKERAALAEALGMDRGQLVGLLMGTELLKVRGGKNGELAINPEAVLGLHQAGVASLAALAALRGLPAEDFAFIFGLLTRALNKMGKPKRLPGKRDLQHWARTAGRMESEIVLLEEAGRRGEMTRGEAQELVAAWYLDNLLWETLRKRERDMEALRAEQRQEDERRAVQLDDERREGERREQQRDDERAREELLELEYDPQRQDKLMCFWITDANTDPLQHNQLRRLYVCVDPDSGEIIPQGEEAEANPRKK